MFSKKNKNQCEIKSDKQNRSTMHYTTDHVFYRHDWEEYTRSYDTRYCAEIEHLGLKTHRIIKDYDNTLLNRKVEAQYEKWANTWNLMQTRNQVQALRELNQSLADDQTQEAKAQLEQVEQLLLHTLDIDDSVDWDELKATAKFSEPYPEKRYETEIRKVNKPVAPVYKQAPNPPDTAKFEPDLDILDKIFKFFGDKKRRAAQERFERAHQNYSIKQQAVEDENRILLANYNRLQAEADEQISLLKRQCEKEIISWKEASAAFYAEQEAYNERVEGLKNNYLTGEANAIIEYCELVLNRSVYPETFPKDFDLEYNPDNKLLVVDYVLPAPEQFPRLTEVKYIAARKELKEYYLSDVQLAKLYDNAIYKIALRTLHELFEADQIDAIQLIAFNGWVNSIDKGTGKPINACIISIQVNKQEFEEIKLAHVDPKTCFKNLKGVGSSKLVNMTPIQPIIKIDRNDKRFVSSYDVANTLDEGYNLATMKWEDFEHLIRELFEREFSSNGGDVKVTRASRDGGVDAIAFDPDPIRGGKIVIQAKRYNNTVGVSAVRDLYGTVLNEGATKGILVTTSDYGPDAYEFAKNKPITLMSGNNLLYLLEKHGHKARINLKEG